VNGSTSRAAVPREQETGSDTGGGFVFGQNLSDRVILPSAPDSTDIEDSNVSTDKTVGKGDNHYNQPPNLVDLEAQGLSVIGSSAACSSSTSPTGASKRKFEAITGEEDESNVLQIHCKLFQWERDDSSWKEKGKGFLKLNDKKKEDKLCSRLG
jgi:Ran-binding protein 3